MVWNTAEHGEIPCTFHGFTDDGRVIIRVPDPYDQGQVELQVPRAELHGLELEQTMVAVRWTER